MNRFALLSAASFLGAALLFSSPLALRQTAPASAQTALERYVSLGDSITAGYQSGGLRADGQARAYPVLLAKRLGVGFAAPLGRDPGCPPPLGARTGAASCARLTPGAVVSNFAVPGARVEDLLTARASTVAASARPLYSLILGPNDSQVSAALKARPQLISVWIGANNVLGAALSGDAASATPPAQFERAYAALLGALKPANARLVLLTVPDVTSVPALVPGARLAGFGLGDASCANTQNRVPITRLLGGELPLSCDAPYALTPSEARAVQETVAAYNASIRRLAAREGALVFDVNEVQTSANATYDPTSAAPFGPDFSLDGVHPSNSAHARLANALAAFLGRELGLPLRAP